MPDDPPSDAELERFLVARLGTLRAGSTMCPGRLARDAGQVLASIRPLLAHLAHTGVVRITQRGAEVDLAVARGPFRVSLRRPVQPPSTQGET